jgi:hypothetical protein
MGGHVLPGYNQRREEAGDKVPQQLQTLGKAQIVLSYTWMIQVCVAKNVEGCLTFFWFLLSYLACTQIWLTLPVDHNLHFGYITKLSQ